MSVDSLNDVRKAGAMIISNKNCPGCGSRFTYAVPSRNKVKVGPDDKIMRDESGREIMVKCRRCRSCGDDYYDDMIPKLTSQNKVTQDILDAALQRIKVKK
jgi:hypothetical protein